MIKKRLFSIPGSIVIGLIIGIFLGLFLYRYNHPQVKAIDTKNMTRIHSGEHFLPKYEVAGEKVVADIVADANNNSGGLGSKIFTVDPDTYDTLQTNDKNEDQFDRFIYTEIGLRVYSTRQYTKIKFSTAMNFNKYGSSILKTNSLTPFKSETNTITGETTLNTGYFKNRLVGLCVIHDSKDVTNKGELRIKDGLITWKMNAEELKRVNDSTSDDDFYFFVFQTKPKDAIK